MRILMLLAILVYSHSSFSQSAKEDESLTKRESKRFFVKLDAGQILMQEFGINTELLLKNNWSIGASIGFDRASLFYITQFGKKLTDGNYPYSEFYKWGEFLSFSGRKYLSKKREFNGFYAELELKYKKWSISETENGHGNYSMRYKLNDIQLNPLIGLVISRKHWIEMYLGLGIVNSFGIVDGPKWVGFGSGDNGSAFNHIHENVNFISIRPKTGVRFCF